MARIAEVRREFEAAQQQMLGVLGAIQAHGDFGQHADRDDIGWCLLQVVAQLGFRFGNVICPQRISCAHQYGIMHAVLHVAQISLRCAGAVSGSI